jgi:hypothetical protein
VVQVFREVLVYLKIWVPTFPVVEKYGSYGTVDPTCKKREVRSRGGGWWRREKSDGNVAIFEIDFRKADIFLWFKSFRRVGIA